MEKQYILWTDDLNVNIEIIDAQHKKIIDILNKLYEMHLNEKYTLVNEVIQELKDFTNYHFDAEEKILKEIDFHEYLDQKTRHDKFKKLLLIYSDFKIVSGLKEMCKNLLFFVQNWFISHIKNVDKKSFSGINEKKART